MCKSTCVGHAKMMNLILAGNDHRKVSVQDVDTATRCVWNEDQNREKIFRYGCNFVAGKSCSRGMIKIAREAFLFYLLLHDFIHRV